METPKTIWRILLWPLSCAETTEIDLKEYEVVKETALQYRCVMFNPQRLRRINKIAIDKEPGLLGGGKWYSSKEKALEAWLGYHKKMAQYHTDIAANCLRKMMEDKCP